MFKKKTKELELTEMNKAILKAIENEDWELVEMLKTAEKEYDKKVFKARLTGVVSGAVLTHVGNLIGIGINAYIDAKMNSKNE